MSAGLSPDPGAEQGDASLTLPITHLYPFLPSQPTASPLCLSSGQTPGCNDFMVSNLSHWVGNGGQCSVSFCGSGSQGPERRSVKVTQSVSQKAASCF